MSSQIIQLVAKAFFYCIAIVIGLRIIKHFKAIGEETAKSQGKFAEIIGIGRQFSSFEIKAFQVTFLIAGLGMVVIGSFGVVSLIIKLLHFIKIGIV